MRKSKATRPEKPIDVFSLLRQLDPDYGEGHRCPACEHSPCDLLREVANVLLASVLTVDNGYVMRTCLLNLKFGVERHLQWASAEMRAVKPEVLPHTLERRKSDEET